VTDVSAEPSDANTGYAGVVEVLQALIGIDSVNRERGGKEDAERDIGRCLADRLRATGCAVHLQRVRDNVDNVIGILEVDKTRPFRIFCAHMDTVNVEGMTVDPFVADVRDGRVYGRGACDTKGSVAAMLTAFARYAAGPEPRNNTALLFSVDEETGKAGVKAFCDGFMNDRLGTVEGVVVGEPSEMKIVSAHGGCVRFAVETGGVACHSSKPHLGESAILNMMTIIRRLEEEYAPTLNARSHSLTGHAVCSVTRIEGGKEINIIPDRCVIHVDRRVVPGEDSDTVYREMVAFLEPYRESCRCRVHPPMVTDYPLDNPDGSAFIGKIRAVFDAGEWPSELCGVVMGTEASDFSRRGVPAVVIGPGSADQAHQNDEWVGIDQLQWAENAYFELMRM